MSGYGINIEEVVREVMRRLANCGGPQHPNAPRERAIQKAGQIEIRERVVSVEQLNLELENVQQIVVRSDAIVTPAACDLLNEKGIKITRGGSSPGSAAGGPRLALAAVDTDYDMAGLAQELEKATISALQLKRVDLVATIHAMTEHITKSEPGGVILTGETAAALCLANRQNCLRAALAANVDDVGRAIESIGVNLLVVDPAGRSLHELLRMIKQFALGGPKRCPALLRSS